MEAIDESHFPKENRGGNCYEAALEILAEIDDAKNARLVHARVQGRGAISGYTFGHAWVEHDGLVYDNSNGAGMVLTVERYYELARPSDIHRYDLDDVIKHIGKTDHCGPWAKSLQGVLPIEE